MNIISLIYRQYRKQFVTMFVLTLLSGLFGIGVLAFINGRLLQGGMPAGGIMLQFALLLVAYLAVATLSQIQLSKLGHQFVFEMRTQLLKRIMDSQAAQIQLTGKPKLLASLSNDIRSISMAFTRLPEFVQGVLFSVGCSLYLIWLSPKLFVVTAVILLIMVLVSNMVVKRVFQSFRKMRGYEDELYAHYETSLDGHKELTLNRYRAERFYHEDFSTAAQNNRNWAIRADSLHALAINWGNVSMLAAVGIIFYLATYHQWASLADAATITMTVLFMRSPLSQAIGAFPMLMNSQVGLNALNDLGLAEYQSGFHSDTALPDNWQTIRLENVTYDYPAQGGQQFALQPVNLTLKRHETVFLIGANGSGKSTLSMILAGLYQPSGGKIFVDDIEITEQNRDAYRRLFASVFTDFHLFDKLIDGMGADAADDMIAQWLEHLHMSEKVKREQNRILNNKLSQGQKKRLALLAAAAENRSMLILDEWAADQDPQFRRIFYEELLPLLKAQGYTVFAISHDDKYFNHAERILSMKQGVLSEYNAEDAVKVADEHSRS
ncbi:multidrug ABC transporter permease/ATP-binding protein [Neisseria perflava]|uniref:multidrug ABC transporter permease/ATP-binding protein n=1 Tax=Neisseria perflava TaxID=33053 RepID=UPI00209D7EB9|nr:multidrug ABC transporter permease/ATP-binding protein [Neisseria perflava]MCP1659432.1 putative ATP-binding cassette transporter [Neisseria perflava]MCP1772272.1 putative ATP-binding cassette transporter [Neisseria perflava]